MKNPSPPTSSEHPDALLLPYVEDLIAPAERAGVEEHLSTCQECASRVEGLRQTIAALRENKMAFCPEPWELHEFARSGNDPHGVISTHVDDCPFCSEDLRAWKSAALGERMPAELWSRLRERLPRPAPRQTLLKAPRWHQVLLGNIAWFKKMPALAAALAAAVLLVVVTFFPRDMTQPMIGLSAISWEGIPKPKSVQKNAAFVIFFKDFKEPVPQELVDSLYEALKPSMDVNERYDIVSPAEISDAVKSGQVLPRDRAAMIEGLRKNLNVSRAIIISVSPSADKLSARIELIDTASSRTLQTKTEQKVDLTELDARIRSDVHSMLLQPNDQP